METKTAFTIPPLLLEQVARTFLVLPESADKVLALLTAIKPRDDLEAMLIAQMIGCHNIAIRFAARAMETKQIPFMDKFTSIAAKAMRTYAIQMETLKKHRDGWGQTMKIEHVHVYEGGQAIVGSVSHGESGD